MGGLGARKIKFTFRKLFPRIDDISICIIIRETIAKMVNASRLLYKSL
jgi:hypothetical protein